MQPVAHCIDYYQHLINNFQPTRHATTWLWDWKNHYELLNARLSLREEDAYNKLLEADELKEPTPLEHYIQQTDKP